MFEPDSPSRGRTLAPQLLRSLELSATREAMTIADFL